MYIIYGISCKYFFLGLSMRLLETKDDLHFFTFEHSKQYQSVQIQFIEAVESFNPDNIVVICSSIIKAYYSVIMLIFGLVKRCNLQNIWTFIMEFPLPSI